VVGIVIKYGTVYGLLKYDSLSIGVRIPTSSNISLSLSVEGVGGAAASVMS
jgi:hypothetical protein